MEFFATFYEWFKSFYGENLSLFLWGYNPLSEEYTNPNLFNTVGVITLALSLLCVVVYYYFINHPRSNWKNWLLVLGENALVSLFVGFGYVNYQYNSGAIPQDLVKVVNPDNTETIFIGTLELWGFGLANFFVSILFFVALSFILKWWSSGAKHVPV